MGKSSGENSNTHTHFYTHIQTHLYTHIPSIPLNEAASLASTLQLLPPLFACLVLHSSSLPHTHTHTHRVPSKKKWLPHALLHRTPSAFGAHYTLGLSCLKIDKLILKLYKQRLSSLSLSLSPSYSPSVFVYLLLFSMRLFCPLYCLFTPSATFPLANLFVAQIVLAFEAKQLLCCCFF